MAIASVGSFVHNNDKVSGDAFTVTVDESAAAGVQCVLIVTGDNASTSDGNTSEFNGVVDSSGNNWIKLREFCNGEGAANTGAIVAVFLAQLGRALTAAVSTITVYSVTKTAKALCGWQFSVATGNTLALAVNGTADLADDIADAGSMTLSSLGNIEHLFVRAIAMETNAPLHVVSANYTAFTETSAVTSGGLAASNMAAAGEFRILTGTTDTNDPTTLLADQASIMLALDEIELRSEPRGRGRTRMTR